MESHTRPCVRQMIFFFKRKPIAIGAGTMAWVDDLIGYALWDRSVGSGPSGLHLRCASQFAVNLSRSD